MLDALSCAQPWRVVILVCGLLAGAACIVQAEESGQEAYLAELIDRARAAGLADAREWHLLLHYRPNV
jgi:hypothetical protein